MNRQVRAGHFGVAFVAALALVVGSTFFAGALFWGFSAGVIGGAAWAIWWLYVRTSKRWLMESYRMLGEARLSELKPRVEAELQRSGSGVDRSVLEQLWAETLFWSGEFDRAYEVVTAVNTSRMPVLWRGATVGLKVTSSILGGHVERAREIFEGNRALLEQRPGLHHLEALIALRSGDPAAARARYLSTVESWERPPLVRAALAMIEAEIAVALGENADAPIKVAKKMGGESWVKAAADKLDSQRKR